MTRRILDTSVLVSWWHKHCRNLATKSRSGISTALVSIVKKKAKAMIQQYGSSQIVTPVAIEFLAGFTRREEMELGEVFLEELDCIDRGQITPEDWKEVRRLARRIPRDGRPRQLGDCLIRALANRFARDVFTPDRAFPR